MDCLAWSLSQNAGFTVRTSVAHLIVALAITLSASSVAYGQGRTDVVILANVDRITGEVLRLNRGRLEFKTDDAGTLYLEWHKLISVVAARIVEVVTGDGRRFVGSLGRANDRSISIVGPGGTATLPMIEVTIIRPIGGSFWGKLDGSVDAGFNYTRSSGVAQLNYPSLSDPAVSACSSMPASSANSSRISSSDSVSTTPTTTARQTRLPIRTTSASSCRLAGAIDDRPGYDINSTITSPQMMSKVLPTAYVTV
jgi:hypothetical protein